MAELTFEDAEGILKPFVCNDQQASRSDAQWQSVRDALQIAVDRADFLTLGICADSPAQAFSALTHYLQAFGDPVADLDPSASPATNEPVYLKVNTQRRSLHWDSYSGPYRGVLVTCQFQDLAKSGGTYGHFPLNLFAGPVG